MDHDMGVHLSEDPQPVGLQDDDGAQDHASRERGVDAAGAYRVTCHWWFNELGMLTHLRCGRRRTPRTRPARRCRPRARTERTRR